MNRTYRVLLFLGAIIIAVLGLGTVYYLKGFSSGAVRRAHHAGRTEMDSLEWRRLDARRVALRDFAIRHGYNPDMAFLVDMGLPSGKYRFFVTDLNGDSVLLAGLVAHGSGNRTFSLHPSFSNVDNSGCSSMGRYRVGDPYPGHFGRAYRLYGLDSTNDHAFRRNIVLHSYSYVPEAETDPMPICNSLGCAMVSPGFLRELQPLIDRSRRPILLWVFD